MRANKTEQALKLLEENPGMSVYAAAKACGITPTTLYTGQNRARLKSLMLVCPCCDSEVREFKLPQVTIDQLKGWRAENP